MRQSEKKLVDIQNKIASIDTEILKLLDLRFEVIKKIASLKKVSDIIYAPDREARALRVLMQRNKGGLKSLVLARIWREIVSASEQLYKPFAVSVYVKENPHGMMELAKNYFGAATKYFPGISVSQTLQKVDSKEAGVAVLPLFDQEESWWTGLDSKEHQNLRIVARLPFVKSEDNPSQSEAFIVSTVEAEETGYDRSLFAIEMTDQISIGALKSLLEQSNLKVTQIWPAYDLSQIYLFAVELEGYLTVSDSSVIHFVKQNEKNIQMIRRIGGYAVQEITNENDLLNEADDESF